MYFVEGGFDCPSIYKSLKDLSTWIERVCDHEKTNFTAMLDIDDYECGIYLVTHIDFSVKRNIRCLKNHFYKPGLYQQVESVLLRFGDGGDTYKITRAVLSEINKG